jgi:hypothetical protein
MRLAGVRITTRRLMAAMLLIAVYFASYRALVTPSIYQESQRYRDQVGESYRCAPRLCTIIFAPANRLDRTLRPGYWAKPACVW